MKGCCILQLGLIFFSVADSLCLKTFIEIFGCICFVVILWERSWEIFLPFLPLLEAGENKNNCPSNGSSVSFTQKVMVTYEKVHISLFYSLHLLVCSLHFLLTSYIYVLWCNLGFFPYWNSHWSFMVIKITSILLSLSHWLLKVLS